ncbi:CHAP domain-containing protein [Actinomadura oligospora]|uniref:CHAP domain-containing protein n=1 Tax=Actinomadura oligospora TaxID=111804 RepID=UPI00047E360D|nr:CHAP domain-containing protein [Actinomadura oligospora]
MKQSTRSRPRRLTGVLAVAAAVPAAALALQAMPATAAPAAPQSPAQAASALRRPPGPDIYTLITNRAKAEAKNTSRNKANNKGRYNCNFYSGYWQTSGSGGCSTKGWRANEWCADFVWYVWRQAGAFPKRPLPSEGVSKTWKYYAPTFAGSFYRAGNAEHLYRSKGYYTGGRMPVIGSAVMFDWGGGKPGNDGWGIDHVGIVVATDSAANKITTVEGNSSGQAIRTNTYKLSDRYIVGYMLPR